MAMKKHIVCIDDDPQVLTTLRLVLEHEGFQVTMARGGRQGLEAIRQLKPDLVVLDLMMPEMDGWEVYQQVKLTMRSSISPLSFSRPRAARLTGRLDCKLPR